jgi:hypothetical protein
MFSVPPLSGFHNICGHVHLACSCARACRVAVPARVARPFQREILGMIGARGRFPKGNGGALRAHSRQIVLILAARYARIPLTESTNKGGLEPSSSATQTDR